MNILNSIHMYLYVYYTFEVGRCLFYIDRGGTLPAQRVITRREIRMREIIRCELQNVKR